MRALLRRTAPPRLDGGPLEVREAEHDVYAHGRPLGLTEVEFELFVALLEAGDAAVGRDRLFERVLGRGWDGLNRTVDVHVSKLRHKLGPHGDVRAARGVGYRLWIRR
ncbi:MAG: winged helix-turn-helix domain-containing protein [Myxococcota bacterium]